MKPEAQRQEVTDFVNDADYDVIEYMALADEDPAGARLAWAEFYRRHVRYLYPVLMQRFAGRFLEDSIETLVEDTLTKAFEKANTFEPKLGQDRKSQEIHVRSWLGTIAHRLLIAEYRRHRGLELVYADKVDSNGKDGWEAVANEASRIQERRDVHRDELWEKRIRYVQEAYDEILTDTEREIFNVTVEHEAPGQAHQRLPSGVAKELAAALTTTPDNIRQIRRRARKKVADYVKRKIEEQL